MKERIKKIFKKAFIVIMAVVILYNLVFDTVSLPTEKAMEIGEKYDEFVLFTTREISWYLEKFQPFETVYGTILFNKVPVIGFAGGDEKNIVFFRWKAMELKKQLESKVVGDLEGLKKSGDIYDYTFDKATAELDVFIDYADVEKYWKTYSYIEHVWQKENLATLAVLKGRGVRDSYVEIHEVRPVEKPKPEPKEYVYYGQEIDLVNEIVSQSLNKDSFDFKNENKIKGDSEDGTEGHIRYLDLSDYNDITGKLDLTGFPNLQYVLLRGMKISEVLLPESLERIDDKSFAYCEKLEKVTIPKGVRSINNPIFYGCKNLKEISFEGDAPEVSGESRDVFGKVPEDLVIYRKKSAKGWQEICWDKYDVRIID